MRGLTTHNKYVAGSWGKRDNQPPPWQHKTQTHRVTILQKPKIIECCTYSSWKNSQKDKGVAVTRKAFLFSAGFFEALGRIDTLHLTHPVWQDNGHWSAIEFLVFFFLNKTPPCQALLAALSAVKRKNSSGSDGFLLPFRPKAVAEVGNGQNEYSSWWSNTTKRGLKELRPNVCFTESSRN